MDIPEILAVVTGPLTTVLNTVLKNEALFQDYYLPYYRESASTLLFRLVLEKLLWDELPIHFLNYLMESLKIDNHLKEHGSNLDVWAFDKTLSSFVKNELQRELAPNEQQDLTFKKVQKVLQETKNIDLDLPGAFENIKNSFKLDINDSDQIFVIWDMNGYIDVISAGTLSRYWDSVWYGVGDEAALLYVPHKFIILITDWGEAKFKLLN